MEDYQQLAILIANDLRVYGKGSPPKDPPGNFDASGNWQGKVCLMLNPSITSAHSSTVLEFWQAIEKKTGQEVSRFSDNNSQEYVIEVLETL